MALFCTCVHFVCDQLKEITDRMVKSLDFDINGFFSEIDRSLEASRRVFQRLDSVMMPLTEADWLRIEAKVLIVPVCWLHLGLSVSLVLSLSFCLQCFDTVGWASGRASGLYKIG